MSISASDTLNDGLSMDRALEDVARQTGMNTRSQQMNDEHIDGDHLDEYALGRMPESDIYARIEEHLLVCKACQDRLIMLDKLRTALSIYDRACRRHD